MSEKTITVTLDEGTLRSLYSAVRLGELTPPLGADIATCETWGDKYREARNCTIAAICRCLGTTDGDPEIAYFTNSHSLKALLEKHGIKVKPEKL